MIKNVIKMLLETVLTFDGANVPEILDSSVIERSLANKFDCNQ